MSDFYTRFLTEDGQRLKPENGRYIALGAFGKHPGWDDHIEDLGLDTDSLNVAKQVFYVQGVGGQINTGAWEKLNEEQRLAAFEHTFVWLRGGQFLMGQLWSSSDGKGRTRYPMVICAHCAGVPLKWALQSVLPRLIDVERECREAKTAEEVRSILSAARARLRNAARTAVGRDASETPDPGTLSRFVSAPVFGPGHEGWFRFLYWLRSQAAAFTPRRFEVKEDMSDSRAQQARVPMGMASPAEALPLWARFVGGYVDPLVPLLFAWPADGSWLDITFGEPSTQEFFCLRASRTAIPLTTEIPYEFDPKFRELAARLLTDFQDGLTPRATDSGDDEATSDAGVASTTQRWFKNLTGKFLKVLVALLLLGAAAGGVLLLNPSARSGARNQVPLANSSEKSAATVPPKTGSQAGGQIRVASVGQNIGVSGVEPKVGTQVPPTAGTNVVLAEKVNVKPAGAIQAGASGEPITNSIGMILLWIAGLPNCGDGGWVGKYEVTQAEYERVAGFNPSTFKSPTQPVENLTWNEAADFCKRLSDLEKGTGRLPPGFAYAMPTQQQWDFFLSGADFEKAVTSRNQPTIRTAPSPVGTMPPNRYGLYDVLGNVWEWCADSDSPEQKVSKGGAYDNLANFQFRSLERTTARRTSVNFKSSDVGFRCVLVSQP